MASKSSSSGNGLAFVIALVIVILVVSKLHLAAHAGVGHLSGSASCKHLEKIWERNGGRHSGAFMAAEIAMAESGGRKYAKDIDPNGTVDKGLWQINSIHGAMSTYNVNGNAKAAIALSGDGRNWNDWTTYLNGAYEGKC